MDMAIRIDNIPSRTLIQLVKQRPALWDKDHRSKKNSCAEREEAWNQIFVTLVPNYDQMDDTAQRYTSSKITRRWYNIRDSYKKALKYNRGYTYSKLLSFLESVYKENADKTTYDSEDSTHVNTKEEIDKDDSDNMIEEVYLDDEREEEESSLSIDDKSQEESTRNEGKETNDINMIGVLSNLIAREQEEDRGFFNSIMPSVKKLPQDIKMEFRLELMKLLQRCQNKAKERGD